MAVTIFSPLRSLCAALCGTVLAAGVAGAAPSRVIVADFEDVGTWRMKRVQNVDPNGWFSGTYSMGGSFKEERNEAVVGELRFAFDPASKGPFSMQHERMKMSMVDGFVDEIAFEAHDKGLPVSVWFEFLDSSKKRFRTVAVELSGNDWRQYSLPINAQTLHNYAACRFPIRLQAVVVSANEPVAGSIFMDDITLVGDFAKKNLLSVTPVYEDIFYAPEKPVQLAYRLRNARGNAVTAAAQIEVRDFFGMLVYRGEQQLPVDAYGSAELVFDAGVLPVSAYEAKVLVSTEGVVNAYEDTFCVIVPNNGRINTRPMWFGIQDHLAIWQSPGENELHLQWMYRLGVDIDRMNITPSRFERQEGVFNGQPYADFFKGHAAIGMDVLLLAFETPHWAQAEGSKGLRKPPTDYARFEAYNRNLGRFLKDFPNVTYLEMWNEPDIGFFDGTLEDYLKMLETAYRAIKEENPAIKVTSGGVTVLHPRQKEDFSRRMFVEGSAFYDVAALHAHGPLGNYRTRQEMVEGWLEAAGIVKPTANTESGERSGYSVEGRARQAIALVQKMAYSKAQEGSEVHIWFTLQDYWDMDENVDDSFGLVTSDNRAKPSFGAYNELIRQLSNTTSLGKVDLSEHITAYAFLRDDGKTVYVLWPDASFTGSLIWLDAHAPVQMVDMFGRSEALPVVGEVIPLPVTRNPVYLIPQASGEAAVLRAAAPDRVFLSVDPQVRYGADAGSISSVLRNPLERPLRGSLLLVDASGNEVARSAVDLKPGQSAQFDLQTGLVGDRMAYRLLLREDGSEQALVQLPVNPVSVYSVPKLSGEDMGAAYEIVLNTQQDVHELAFDPAIPAWAGAEDLSAAIRFSHDGKFLRLRAVVTDNIHLQKHEPEFMWRGDSLQFAIGKPESADYTVINIGDVKGKAAVWCHRHVDASARGLWDIPASVERRGDKTIYDVRIPLEKVGLKFDGKPLPILLSLLINEDDGQGRVRWMQWHDGIGTAGYDANLLGRAVLEP